MAASPADGAEPGPGDLAVVDVPVLATEKVTGPKWQMLLIDRLSISAYLIYLYIYIYMCVCMYIIIYVYIYIYIIYIYNNPKTGCSLVNSRN